MVLTKKFAMERELELVLQAIRLGGRKVHESYLGLVLCLASRESLTDAEMNELRLRDGRRIFFGDDGKIYGQ